MFNTEQIKKEAVEDFVKMFDVKPAFNRGVRLYTPQEIQELAKQYLEKGQNESN